MNRAPVGIRTSSLLTPSKDLPYGKPSRLLPGKGRKASWQRVCKKLNGLLENYGTMHITTPLTS